MIIRNAVLFLVAFILLTSCMNEDQEKFLSYEKVSVGQFLISVDHAISEGERFYKVVDTLRKKAYPAQRTSDLSLVFLSDRNDFPDAKSFKVIEISEPFSDLKVVVESTDEEIKVSKGGKPVLNYQKAERLPEGFKNHYRRSGFIHPLFSPKGKVVSDDFPLGHAHQHAVFFAFVNTTFRGEKVDFWNQQKETGTIDFSTVLSEESGSVFGRFVTEQDHRSLKHGVVLKEQWEVTIYNTEPFQIDIETSLVNISSDTLFINDHLYGGMAFRGAKEWNMADSIHFKNEAEFNSSEGKDRIKGNHSRPKWSSLSGLINGEEAGAAILGEPSNFRYPEPVRIHPEMPYFCLAPMVGHPFNIPPSGIFKGKFTYVTFDGPVPKLLLDSLVLD